MSTPANVVLFKTGVTPDNRIIERDTVINEIFPSLQRRAERGALVGEIGQPKIDPQRIEENPFARNGQSYQRYSTIDATRVGLRVDSVELRTLPDGEVAVVGTIQPTGQQAQVMATNMDKLHVVPRATYHSEGGNGAEQFLVLDRIITFDAVPVEQ